MGRDESDQEDSRPERSDREIKEKDAHRSCEKDKDGYREAAKERDRGRDKEREQKDKDKSKDVDRDRDRDRERHRDKEKDRDKETGRDKQRVKERDREKDKERDREREKDRDRDRDHDREKDKDKEREKDRERERERDREKEREKERDREREREREKERDRERLKERERDRDKIREKERDKVRDRDGRFREFERDKDAENRRDRLKDSDRDIERERDADKEKKKDRERDRDKKERERERDRERDAEKERDRDDGERDRERRRDKERDKERERHQDREKESPSDRDRGRQKGSEREKDEDQDKLKNRSKEVVSKEKDKGKDEERSPKELDHKSQILSSELEERIIKMKKQRLRNLETRKSSDKGDGESEIAAWVNKSRSLQNQVKPIKGERAARLEKTLAEQEFQDEESDEEYEAKDLAGLKILHGLDKVMEGGAVVLTLKDRNILAGDDVDEEMDELENIEIAEQKTREDAYKAAKKRPGVYEDKFHNDLNESRTILPQYDDIVKDEGVVLDETGGINEEGKKRLEEIRQRLQNATMKGMTQDSFSSEASRVAADFYTQEEMLQFKKPKKKKKLRRKVDIDIDALEAEAKAAGLGTEDLGSRSSVARLVGKKEEEEKTVLDSRRHAYQSAYEKAVEASKALLPGAKVPVDIEMDEPVFGADEDEELYRSLERARYAALKKQEENGGSVAGPQSVAARLAAFKEEAGSANQHDVVAEGENEKPVVITDIGEFCLSLQLDEVISRRAGAKDVFGEEEDVGLAAAKVPEASGNEGGWIEVKEANQNDELSEEKEEETDLEEPIKETSVGKGLAGALNLLKERGVLKETIDWGGRNMDKKRSKLVGIVDDNPPESTRQRDILLDRVDEFGRTMTPKEAFRRLSHKFHGKGPGKMKQEKKMKQYQEELKLKQMNSGDTPLMSMEKMREAQAKMHTPYIVISGHIKPGQTSDPRSGFATVEKEHIGSLTPMLGDKKVEHFLGIKRKPDAGSMGPPPSKKPKSER